MKGRRLAALMIGLAVTLLMATPVVADTTSTSTHTFTVSEGTELSVAITDSSNFPTIPFTLSTPKNWTDIASYTFTVVDMRGTGDGWTVTASATPFQPEVPNSELWSTNNGLWVASLNNTGLGFSATDLSVINGVSVVPGHASIIAAPTAIFKADPGVVDSRPNGSGTFQTQEVLYYNNFPAATAAGTYSTTVTLTIASID